MLGADVVAAVLKREGIEWMSVFPAQELIDAVAKVGIRPVLCRQERVGMAIADGFSRTTNGKRLGVFAMQRGPGSENAFPGAAQAFSDNVPILLLPGGSDTTREFISPEFDSVENYRNVVKWGARTNYIERIPELMRRAFYQLRTGKGGPVLIELPKDILTGEFNGEIDYTPVEGNRFGPDASDTTKIAKLLLQAESPVIQAGQGCLYAEAWDELQELAELLQAPVMTTLPGKSAFPEDHPLALGASAVSTTRQIAHFLGKADLIFGVGSSLTRTNYGRELPEGPTLIHSTNDPADIHKDYRSDHAIIGDAKLVLEGLIDEIKAATKGRGHRDTRDVGPEVQAIKKQWLDEWMPQLTSNEEPINQYRIIWDLMHAVDRPNTIVTHDAGSPRDQVVPFWESVAPRGYMGWGKSTQLGYGLGITMGAKLAEPDKLCVNMMGDAAIGMVGMDIETAVRNKIGILTIVFNNGVMAIERGHMPYAIEQYDAMKQGGDYAGVAKALGSWGKRVEKVDDFLPSLREAIEVTESGSPAVLDCIVKEGYDFSKYP